MAQKNKVVIFAKQLPNNIFAGFVVSLVAMPLGLGLALASGAPPIAGIISAVVGGILVSILGGSNVTITGPGNGLVVVVLTAITALGNGDMYSGYLFTLAAIICSGALILLLAFANLGKLSDFFPSSAIQGLLAAIGIIILSKQFHIMMGNMDAHGSTVDLLLAMEQDMGGKLKKLNVDGGACKNNLLMQIQADLLGCSLMRPVFIETTSMGAVIAAGLGAGVWNTLHDVKRVWKLEREFTPNLNEAMRTSRLQDWKRAVSRT